MVNRGKVVVKAIVVVRMFAISEADGNFTGPSATDRVYATQDRRTLFSPA